MAHHGPVLQWDIYNADLEPVVGREQGGTKRPVLIVSNDGYNKYFDTLTVLPLTKAEGKTRRVYPFEVLLPAAAAGNALASIVMPQQIRTIAKMRLLTRIGRLADPALRREIEDRMLDHLGIGFEVEG
jgi:mRNA interferase MazF